ncbi:methyltransferase domain-containing protein [Halovenus salina]|uniref:methyltransferase domain-containing protein n=1 Tax=Halovenus salina TaxID=1510225 RepID=UPI002260CE5C|nr:methyltransferase domain-containing protein [Halovenus salina]
MYVLELAGQDDEFGAYEARSGATDVSILAPGLAVARGIDGVEQLAFTHRASRLLGRSEPTLDGATAILEATNLARDGSVAVRAVDVRSTTGIDTQATERALGDILVERGFTVDLDDPDHELRALFSAGPTGEVCALGWLAAASTRDFTTRKPSDRPFFQPGSMDPMLARALVNIAGAGPDTRILDPMCGTGGLLIEAGLVGSTVLGSDVQAKMLRGTSENLAAFLGGDWELLRGSADALALADDSVDGVVFDTPYGRQSKIEGELETLVADALAESRRVASRCVVVGDRSWATQARSVGWSVDATFERRVHRSLTRYVLVLVE